MNYNKVLVKIKNKKECKVLKEQLKDRLKTALYIVVGKEARLDEDWKYKEFADAIIYTSSIQNGQFFKENILSIFFQTYIDTVSSVKQIFGRSRYRDLDVYIQYGKHIKNYRICQLYKLVKK